MSLAAKLASHTDRPDAESKAPRLGTRRMAGIGRDLVVLVGAAITIGISAGVGMILAVLALS